MAPSGLMIDPGRSAQVTNGPDRFRLMVATADDGLTLLDRAGRCVEANPAARTILGEAFDAERPVWQMGPWESNEQGRGQIKAGHEQALGGRTSRVEIDVPVADQRGGVLVLTFRPLEPSATDQLTLLEIRNVTDERRREATGSALVTLSTLGRMATRFAHEVNNPLASIKNSFLLVKDSIPATHPYFRYVDAIDREINRISSVTRRLYQSYRLSLDVDPEASPDSLVNDAVDLIREGDTKTTIDLDTVPVVDGTIAISGPLFRQAVYSLIQLAADAPPAGGPIAVRAWLEGSRFNVSVTVPKPGLGAEYLEPADELDSARSGRPPAAVSISQALLQSSAKAIGAVATASATENGTMFHLACPVG